MRPRTSTIQSNDELVDNMLSKRYIKTRTIERVFRAVDRGDYFPPGYRETDAYKDLPWSCGNIHLSAPSLYSIMLETLDLKPGMSFLNLGSGTGYFNTLAGLLLKQHGTNHGIELNEDCIKHAYKCLEEFKQKSQVLDQFDFCPPVFIQGNCLSFMPDGQYDRVYCGAACQKTHIDIIKEFVRSGGMLMIPYGSQVLRMVRSNDTWYVDTLFSASFKFLIGLRPEEQNHLLLPLCSPLSLQELCRGKIRNHLCEKIWRNYPEVTNKRAIVRDSDTADLEVERPLSPFLGYFDAVTSQLYTRDMWADLHEINTDNVREAHAAELSNVNAEYPDGSNALSKEEIRPDEVAECRDNASFYTCDTTQSRTKVEEIASSDELIDEVVAYDRGVLYGHYIDNNRFSIHMKHMIRQLPLPIPLKLYVNYNREL